MSEYAPCNFITDKKSSKIFGEKMKHILLRAYFRADEIYLNCSLIESQITSQPTFKTLHLGYLWSSL